MNLNPRGGLRPVRNEPGCGFHTDQEEDSPSRHGLRGLSVFLGPLAEARRQVPEAPREQEPCVDMEVGAEARPRPQINRRGPEGCTSHIRG